MTSLAIASKAPVMHVVSCMTIITGARQADLFHRLCMTLDTFQPLVLAS